ncbi:MAG: hypothetical protein KAI81_00775 [Candidatus Marinimicrobia bacterium]|nr:hypothetical protein [Candidatus Neomarinimicrobiota bacterium]
MKKIFLILFSLAVFLFSQSVDEILNNLSLELSNLPEISQEDSSILAFEPQLLEDQFENLQVSDDFGSDYYSLFPLELDTSIIDEEIFNIKWDVTLDDIHFQLQNSDIVRIGEKNYLYMIGKDSLLMAFDFSDNKFRKLSLSFIFPGLESVPEDTFHTHLQAWFIDRLGLPDKLLMRDFNPNYSRVKGVPGEKKTWILKNSVVVNLFRFYNKNNSVMIEFKYSPQVDKYTIKNKMDKFFR